MNDNSAFVSDLSDRQIEKTFLEAGAKGIVEYSSTLGKVGLLKIAEELCVTPLAAQKRYEQEARSAQDPRPIARDLLFRRLQDVAGGWPAEPSWETLKDVRYQLIGWCDLLRRTAFEPIQKDIARAFLEMALPPGWHPDSGKDPAISRLFDQFWATNPIS